MLLGSVAACGVDSGVFSQSGSNGPFADDDDGGASSCGSSSICVAVPSEGVLVRVTDGDSCPDGWDDRQPIYDGEALGCGDCSCTPASNGGCDVQVTRYTDATCFVPKDGPTFVADGTCVDVSAIVQAQGYRVDNVIKPGACTPTPEATEPLANPAAACELTVMSTTGCNSGELCLPADDSAQVCILIDGRAPCPAGFEASEVFGSADDQRSCVCSCGAAEGSSCRGDGTLSLSTDNSCGNPFLDVPINATCFSTFAGHNSYRVVGDDFTPGTCPPLDGSSGAIVYGEPQTLCCPR